MPHECYHFEYFPKGFQVKYDRDNNSIRQFFPYSKIISMRLDYIYEDKVHVLTIMLEDSMKFSYTFKSCGDAEGVYKKLLEYF